jgi:hypothetical protein
MVSVSSRNFCGAFMAGCLHPSIAFRPASVILMCTTSIVLPLAIIASGSVATSRRRTRLAVTPRLKPWSRARSTSFMSRGQLASSVSASLLEAQARYRHFASYGPRGL